MAKTLNVRSGDLAEIIGGPITANIGKRVQVCHRTPASIEKKWFRRRAGWVVAMTTPSLVMLEPVPPRFQAYIRDRNLRRIEPPPVMVGEPDPVDALADRRERQPC